MEIKEGMYIRTSKGDIGKITVLNDTHITITKPITARDEKNKIVEAYYHIRIPIIDMEKYPNNYKIKEKLIDLIEEGDYVNGMLIESIYKREKDTLYCHTWDTEIMFTVENKTIKEILTKEQYESNKYKVEKVSPC